MAQKILIVEDEKILQDLLSKRLIQEGYEVFQTYNGQEAMDLMKKSRPDLILLDIIMPKMGGFEMMAEMKKDQKLKDIPIIVISNSGQPVELDKAKELGASDWLIKTEFDPQEVIEKIKKYL